MYIILFMLYYYSMRKMDEHTCYILSLRLTFLQTVNVTSVSYTHLTLPTKA